MLTDRKLVLVTRKTRLQELKERYGTLGQAKFYLEHLGESFAQYEDEHNRFEACRRQVVQLLGSVGKLQQLERGVLPTYRFDAQDIICVLGQDGLVANTLKYLRGQPVIGINPLPDLFDGKLLPFNANELQEILNHVLAAEAKTRSVTLAQVDTNLGESLLAVNDLFIGPRSHSSARYLLNYQQQAEEQSSSGIIVSTGLGSTGWFRSIIAGASGVAGKPVQAKIADGFPWEAPYLYYSVREPFPSRSTSCKQVFGRIEQGKALKLTSRMPDSGVIFSDGMESDAISFSAGTIASISVSKVHGALVSG